MEFLILMAFGFGLIWLLLILPQRRRAAQHEALVAGLTPGDEVITAGGLYGTVTELGEEDVGLEIADGVEVRVARRAIAAVLPEEDEGEDLEEEGIEAEPEPELEQEPAAGERKEGR